MTKVQFITLITAVALTTVVIGAVVYNRHIKHTNNLHMRFNARLSRVLIFLAWLFTVIDVIFDNFQLSEIVLKGSALIVAIIGFAAQPVISDLIGGYIISANKPFEIGDRIVIEGQQPGIVEDITLRHTVIRIYDDIRIVVPNSVLNSKIVTNTSYKSDTMKVHLKFSVSYDTKVSDAIDIIRDCVAASPYTLGVTINNIQEDSGPVYFLEFGESALILETTLLVRKGISSYVAVTDINNRVNTAFSTYGIEIPYNYVNVVDRYYDENDSQDYSRKTGKRNYRTSTVTVSGNNYLDQINKLCGKFAYRQNLTGKVLNQINLLSEESLNLVADVINKIKITFWIDGTQDLYRIHLHVCAGVSTDSKDTLINIASQYDDNTSSLSSQIWGFIANSLNSKNNTNDTWSLSDSDSFDDISRTLLTKLATDIKVTITKDATDIVVIKQIS